MDWRIQRKCRVSDRCHSIDVFQSIVFCRDVRLEYKWHCQLPQITVTDPDYENQTVPYIHPSVNGKHVRVGSTAAVSGIILNTLQKLQVQRACFGISRMTLDSWMMTFTVSLK